MDYRRPHDHLKALEGYNSLSSMLFIFKNSGCTKTELYSATSRSHSMADKINDLEEAGLVQQVQCGRSVRIYITDLGAEVGTRLSEVEDLLSD